MTLSPVTTPVQTFSIDGAADACGVSVRTIHRRMPVLREHGAAKDADGHWSIPWAALVAAGMTPGKPREPDPVASHTMTGMPSQDLATVAAELAEERAARKLAEGLLDAERRVSADRAELVDALKVTVSVLQRQLEAGVGTAVERPANPSAASTEGADVAAEPSVEASGADTPAPVVEHVDTTSVQQTPPGKRTRWERIKSAFAGD